MLLLLIFYDSYSFARTIIKNAVPSLVTPKFNDEHDDNPSPCLLGGVNFNKFGYAVIDTDLMISLFGEHRTKIDKTYPSPYAHRICSMVSFPNADWKWVLEKEKDNPLESHHKCFIPNCVNPLHNRPEYRKEHNKLHVALKDGHPIVDTQNQHLEKLDFLARA